MEKTETHVCRKCGRRLGRDDFYKDNSRPDGVNRWCKDCVRDARFSTVGLVRTQRILSRFTTEALIEEVNRRLVILARDTEARAFN